MRKFVTSAVCASVLAIGLVLGAVAPSAAGVSGLAAAADPVRTQGTVTPAAPVVQLASCIRRNTVCRRVNGRRVCRVYRIRVRCQRPSTFNRTRQRIRNRYNKNPRRYRRYRNGGPGVRG